ncbi:sodium:solute symporter family transporter [Chromobacterium violaceum]|uniref:sodium:solute symporter family transporter n=1 Tax=Chromobacterium violaceum TaxID=536 RepID=UPI0009D9D648|nr:cation/acetate symporter ActP [Chromobacterium violaceum]OQS45488.1 cation acetate symporter [Chromobacterium violaceum]OQS47141.1 cation acetate symporter [Chromobacterium violaceum]QRO32508.1 cation/acetate symporter ActP [Chromobacterium violaceum]QRQ17691.1 cation/acetate symporter ActP [Chromobacterium violaceum]
MSASQLLFLALTLLTLGLTAAARRRTASLNDFYTAGGRLPPWQNGLALAGDYLSAAAFLGAAGMYLGQGYDSLAYAVGTLAGWPLLLLLLAGPLRRRGRYTVAGVLSQRFDHPGVRLVSIASSLTVTLCYLIVQLVGAGKLIELLFGLPYLAAVGLVGALMMAYVALGGMLAATWVQISKASLLFVCALLLAASVLARYGGSPAALFAAAAKLRGAAAFLPSQALADPVEALSLGLGLSLGLLGLPHVLMRFFTVADARAARRSVGIATWLVAAFFLLNLVIGYGAMTLVGPDPQFHAVDGKLIGGGNMAALHLAALLGGDFARALVAAVAFATILAVVAGLMLAGASAVSHDLYASWLKQGRADPRSELKVSRLATLGLGLAAMLLSTLFQQLNIAVMMGLAFAIAASANFPLLLLALHWRGLSARGVVWGGAAGIASSLALIVCGPAVWMGALGHAAPLFPYSNPALFSLPLAFAAAWLGSRRANQSTHPRKKTQ